MSKTTTHISACALLAATCMLLVTACGSDNKPMEIKRLDRLVAQFDRTDAADRDAQIADMQPGIELYLLYNGEPTDDVAASLQYMSHTPAVSVFSADVDALLPSLDTVETELGKLAENISKDLPAASFSDVYAIVSANPYESIVVSDTTVMVALNHYLGADYAGYQGLPDYRRALKTSQRIPIDIAEAVVSVAYPYQAASDERLVNAMLYDGAVLYAMSELMPWESVATLAGWSESDLTWLEANETEAYNAMIERDLLFATSADVFDRLLSPSPATTILHPDAPGRAARFTGYRIAREYVANNPGTTLAELLSPAWYNSSETLAKSGYNPR